MYNNMSRARDRQSQIRRIKIESSPNRAAERKQTQVPGHTRTHHIRRHDPPPCPHEHAYGCDQLYALTPDQRQANKQAR